MTNLPSPSDSTRGPQWARTVLLLAAVYNLAWGAVVVLLPSWSFELSGMPAPRDHLFLWQCVGMIVGVYGIGYAIASTDPFRHWPIVLVGLLGKIFGPLGFIWAVLNGEIAIGFLRHIISNDLIWLIPFTLVLRARYLAYLHEGAAEAERDDAGITKQNVTLKTGAIVTLAELSQSRPVTVVFFRHAGCSFCRELLAQVAAKRPEIERTSQLAFVFMEETPDLIRRRESLKLADVPTILDPTGDLYRKAGFLRAPISRLFGPKEFIRGIAAVLKYGVGNLAGDGATLPGSLVIERGVVTKRSAVTRASEQPELCMVPTNG
jgi:hypothetical protein